MRKRHAQLFPIMVMAVAASVLCHAQKPEEENKPAEQVFKNIQVLKGMPAKQLIPTMIFIQTSLGVECEFCHVSKPKWTPDLDDKDNKKMARKMMAMMRAIDDQNFKGEPRVTCATCHQGHSKPPSTPPLMDATRSRELQAESPVEENKELLPSADALFTKYEKAIGGEAVIAKLHTRVSKGTATTAAGKLWQVDAYQEAPNKLFSHVILSDKSENIDAFDGSHGWIKNQWGLWDLTGSDIDEIEVAADFYRDLRLSRQYPDATVLQSTKLEGHDVFVVRGTLHNGMFTEFLSFDAGSGLLLRRLTLEHTALGDLPDQTDFSDYREVMGVKVPFTLRRAEPGSLVTRTFTAIDFNVPIDDAKFAKPPAEKKSD